MATLVNKFLAADGVTMRNYYIVETGTVKPTADNVGDLCYLVADASQWVWTGSVWREF